MTHIIRATDAVCHVVRCFDDPEVIHVAGGVNPLHDIDIINTELLLAGLDTVEKRNHQGRALRESDGGPEDQVRARHAAEAPECAQRRQARPHGGLTDDERLLARDLFLITMKPQLYVAHVDESGLTDGNAYIAAVEKRALKRTHR